MLPAIFSFSGPALSDRERGFFRDAQPAGFILFNRNVTGRDQVRRLTAELREILGRDRPPILIDQEGGRVQMLNGPPDGLPEGILDLVGRNVNTGFQRFPAPGALGALWARDERAGVRAADLNARLLAAELYDCGITVNCAPCLDVPTVDAHEIIGDRALSPDVRAILALGRAMLHGYRIEGVRPCLKHIPGHGRARADSHMSAPLIDAPLEQLRDTDFAPFKELSDAPFAMTAHAVYAAFDDQCVATLSAETIRKAIRGHCGFDGVLISDAIEMGALSGPIPGRAAAAVVAGCDAALYCSGRLPDMEAIAGVLPRMTPESAARFQAAELWGALTPIAGDRSAIRAERDRLLALN
jgi:beta-N-acetylhexosaminidase